MSTSNTDTYRTPNMPSILIIHSKDVTQTPDMHDTKHDPDKSTPNTTCVIVMLVSNTDTYQTPNIVYESLTQTPDMHNTIRDTTSQHQTHVSVLCMCQIPTHIEH
jgi:hypothetical protein